MPSTRFLRQTNDFESQQERERSGRMDWAGGLAGWCDLADAPTATVIEAAIAEKCRTKQFHSK